MRSEMTEMAKLPTTCKHGEACHIAIDPPESNIKWSLSESGKTFAEGVINKRVPEVAFFVFRPRKLIDGVLQEQLKSGDIVTVNIEAGDATITSEIEVT